MSKEEQVDFLLQYIDRLTRLHAQGFKVSAELEGTFHQLNSFLNVKPARYAK